MASLLHERSTGATAAEVAATLVLAAASWVVAVRQMNGMDMGVATTLGSFAVFVVLWMSVIAALVVAQKLLPPKAAVDLPVALAIIAFGVLIVIAPLDDSRTHAFDVRRRR